MTDLDVCGRRVAKRPYSELGSIDKSNCFCCHGIETSFGLISPGCCGYDESRVDDIMIRLKERKKEHDAAGLIQRTEQTLERLDVIESKLDILMDKLDVPQPLKMSDRT